MKSPKFSLREAELRIVINQERLKFTWKEKLRQQMRGQYLPDPLEFLDIHSEIDVVARDIAAVVFGGSYTAKPPSRYLIEKSKGLCRQIVLPDVRDALVLQCLSDALWHDIKGKAPTTKSFFDIVDNTFKTGADGNGYGPFKSWLQFQKEIFKFSKDRKYVVITDIANYYDFIRYDHLRNTIAGIVDVRESVLDFLIFVLSELLWQPDYMPRIEIGLPQLNFDAPRLMAHCFLYELDEVITRRHSGDYVRFMDDIDVGVDTIGEAKNVIKEIDLTLQSRHVRLNSGKTQILTQKQAAKHFRVRENHFLNKLEAKLKLADSVFDAKFKIKAPKLFSVALKQGVFDGGNGDKILKRVLSYFGSKLVAIPVDVLTEILVRRPSCRGALMKWLSKMPFNLEVIQTFIGFALSDEVVDDFTIVELSKALVDLNFPRPFPLARKEIIEFGLKISPRGFYGEYSSLWVHAKYGTDDELFDQIKKITVKAVTSPLMGRLLGGLEPRLCKSAHSAMYFESLRSVADPSAVQVSNFHTSLRTVPKTFKSVRTIISAPDLSKPNGLSLGKALVILSVQKSTSLSATEKSAVMLKHTKFKLDHYLNKLLT